MKNFMLTLVFLAAGTTAALSQQNRLGISFFAGISPEQSPVTASRFVNIENPLDEFRFNLVRNKKQIHLGLQKDFRFTGPFFGNLGFVYSQQQQTYAMLFTYASEKRSGQEYELSTSARTITVPVNVGVRLGPVDVTSGLMARFAMQSKINGDMMMGIELDQPGMEHGWQAGIGATIWQTRVGIQYQSSFRRHGSELTHANKPLDLRSVPGNVMFTMGLSF